MKLQLPQLIQRATGWRIGNIINNKFFACFFFSLFFVGVQSAKLITNRRSLRDHRLLMCRKEGEETNFNNIITCF